MVLCTFYSHNYDSNSAEGFSNIIFNINYSEYNVHVICMARVGTWIAQVRVHYAAVLVASRTEKSCHMQAKELRELVQGSKGGLMIVLKSYGS